MKFDRLKVVSYKTGALIQKYSPELMLAGGIASFGLSVYYTAKQTPKAVRIIDKKNEEIIGLKNLIQSTEDDVDVVEVKKELRHARKEAVKDVAGIIWKPTLFFSLGLVGTIGSYSIMKKRYGAVVVALGALSKSFEMYRARVRDKYGVEEEEALYHGFVKEKMEIEDPKTGKKKKVAVDVMGETLSPYAVIFDKDMSNSLIATDNEILDKDRLSYIENFANQTLQARGHVLLNELYDALDIRRTEESSVAGWLSKAWYEGAVDDDYFDRADDHVHIEYRPVVIRKKDGSIEHKMMLDFNCDGVIIDKINLAPFYKAKKLASDDIEVLEVGADKSMYPVED